MEEKKVRDVFKDNEDIDIGNCKIANINLYKKTNKVEVNLIADIPISNIKIKKFEEYLKQKFNVSISEINVMYENSVPEIIEEKKTRKTKKEENPENSEENPYIIGKKLDGRAVKTKVKDIDINSRNVQVEGNVISSELKETKNGYIFIKFDLYDGTSTIVCKAFIKEDKDLEKNRIAAGNVFAKLKKAKGVALTGNVTYDPYAKELNIMCNHVVETAGLKKVKRKDESEIKRVELHAHTKMSAMDGITGVTDIIKQAISWGMKSIAITDHGVVQAFPEANKAAKSKETKENLIKVIYGVEAYLVSDSWQNLDEEEKEELDNQEYCIFDIETTGLSAVSEKITEIGAIKMKNGEIIDEFECFVNPGKPIPFNITQITGITDEMVANAETIVEVLPKLIEFIGDATIVAHNAEFDMGFIKYNAKCLNLKIENKYIDTLAMSRQLFPEFKKHKLGIIAENLGIEVTNAHRALDDVKTLVQIFKIMLKKMKEKSDNSKVNVKDMSSYHAIILATTQERIKKLI